MNGPDLVATAPATLPRARVTACGTPTVRSPRSSKIRDRHRDRLAVVYVRQSSPQQVLAHKESRERQYALADHAVALGWPEERVLIIDEDQGRSAKSAEQRLGFQRLLAEVAMNHVGLVLGIDMSRLARSSKDWHHLLEVCALFGTLLADQEGVYDPNDSNDRLLLGLKGTMSEYELGTIRNRMEGGKLNKAARGELFHKVTVGYVKLPSGEVALDPDEQARDVVRLIFDKFDELGTIFGLFHYLVRHDIRVGMRIQDGPRRGQLEWRRPAMPTLNRVLHHPIYAGVYAYGHLPRDPERKASRSGDAGQQPDPSSEWEVFLRDRLPAYITWERYLANRRRLQQNRSLPGSPGAPREGAALLVGLLVCGSCGRHLQASYPAKSNAHYSCERHLSQGTEQICHGLKAAPIDDLVSRQVLRALEPAALELSVRAIQDVEQERERLHRHWKQQLERARYETQRAERQYQAVEPEHRLVARTLERRWEEALQDQRELEDEYDRFLREQPLRIGAEERDRIRALSRDIPTLWSAPGTTAADRKEIIRLLVERVVVHVEVDSEHVDVMIQWRGGFTSRHEIVRPVLRYEQLRDYDRLLDRIGRWRREGDTAAQIAAKLNSEGFLTPKKMGKYTKDLVQNLIARSGLAHAKIADRELGPNEWWLPDLARELQVTDGKLRSWAVRGWVHARQTPAPRLWIIWADGQERRRLKRLQAHSKRGVAPPAELTTPKPRVKGR